MELITIYQKNEEVVSKYGLKEIADIYKQEFAISKENELKEALKEFDDESRELKIGVVGRVKAGKSSLMNALFFDGKDVLPQAVTPMTASLTILKYAEEPKIKVDFYTEDDIKDLKKEYNNYLQKLEKLKEEKIKRLEERYRQKEKTIEEQVQ